MIEIIILGRKLSICNGCSPSILEKIRARWDYPEYEWQLHPFAIELKFENACPTEFPFSQPPSALKLVQYDVEIRTTPDGVWIGNSATGCRFRYSEPGSDAIFWGRGPELSDLVDVVVTDSLRVSGLISLHASIAMRERDGYAIAFLGRSGAGKSTTLVHALVAGYTALCEDFAWCDPLSHAVVGFDRGLRLLPDSARVFEQLHGIRPVMQQGNKWFVPYADMGVHRRTARLASIYILDRQHGAITEIIEARANEAVVALWKASGLPLTPALQDRVSAALAVLVKNTPCYHLRVGAAPIPFERL